MDCFKGYKKKEGIVNYCRQENNYTKYKTCILDLKLRKKSITITFVHFQIDINYQNVLK